MGHEPQTNPHADRNANVYCNGDEATHGHSNVYTYPNADTPTDGDAHTADWHVYPHPAAHQ